MSAGHDHRASQGMGSAEIDRVMAKPEVKAAMARPYGVDREHDLPYLAGYSQDGETIYIDRHLPEEIRIGARAINVDRFIELHEHVEKALIDALAYIYAAAHEIASRLEDRAVVAAGLDRHAYNNALNPYIKADEIEKLQLVPADLDLTPYLDDPALLRRIKAAQHDASPAQIPG